MHSLKLLSTLTRNALKITFYNPFSTAIFTFGKALQFVLYLFFIYYLVTHTKLFAGYTLNQSLILYLTAAVINSLSGLFFREVYKFRPFLIAGELDGVLIKPYHPFWRILVGSIDIYDFIQLVPQLILLTYFVAHEPILHAHSIIFYILFFVVSMMINAALFITVLSIGILFTEVDNVLWFVRELIRLSTYTVDIYTEPFRSFITFVIPVGIMINFPAKVLFNMLEPNLIVVSVVIGTAFLFFSLSLWQLALQKYQSFGG